MADELENKNAEEFGEFDPYTWENLDEAQLKDEFMGLIKRIQKVAALVDKMGLSNNYEETAKEYKKLWTQDLGAGGFVMAFNKKNEPVFGDYKTINSCPPWYGKLTPEQKDAFNASHGFFLDSKVLIKPLTDIGKAMQVIPLEKCFKYMRTTINFDEAGFDAGFYEDLNKYINKACKLMKTGFGQLESRALKSKRYYRDNHGKQDGITFDKGYRAARIADYQFEAETLRLDDWFLPYADGSFGLRSHVIAQLTVIDKYTRWISIIGNIETDLKKAQDFLATTAEDLNAAWEQTLKGHSKALIDACRELYKKLQELIEIGLNLWKCYLGRDDDAPYCFIKKQLPCYANIDGPYGFNYPTEDPWFAGTDFLKLYNNAAEALSRHCYDFVYFHGET